MANKPTPMASPDELEQLTRAADLQQQMFLTALGQLKNEEDAKDAVQEAFTELFALSVEAKSKIEMPKSYLFTILFRKINSKFEDRKKRQSRPPDEEDIVQKSEPPLTKLELEQRIAEEPNKKKGHIFYLHFIMGYNRAEIAAIINNTSGYVRQEIIKFKRKFRK